MTTHRSPTVAIILDALATLDLAPDAAIVEIEAAAGPAFVAGRSRSFATAVSVVEGLDALGLFLRTARASGSPSPTDAPRSFASTRRS